MKEFKHLYNFGDLVKIQLKKSTRIGIIVGIVFSAKEDGYEPVYKCHSEDDQLAFYFKDVKEDQIIEKLN